MCVCVCACISLSVSLSFHLSSLSRLPALFRVADRLTTLRAASNLLEGLGTALDGLDLLEELDLSGNRLFSFLVRGMNYHHATARGCHPLLLYTN